MPRKRPSEPIGPTTIPGQPLDPKIPADQAFDLHPNRKEEGDLPVDDPPPSEHPEEHAPVEEPPKHPRA